MLPVIIGIISSLGVDVRFFRTAILDEIYKPYVRTARMMRKMHNEVPGDAHEALQESLEI